MFESAEIGHHISGKAYKRQEPVLRSALLAAQHALLAQGKTPVIILVNGVDGAGKGETVNLINEWMDPRHIQTEAFGALARAERARPEMWRFWRHVPAHGKTVMFDRSWYGRVLVERVEGFCAQADWMRAYDEINAFEEQLVQGGAVVVKFWLAITPQEQLHRFEERQSTDYKNFKITDADWRNREKWSLYQAAVQDMIDRTSTDVAPWHVVASDDKLFARVETLAHVCECLERALETKT